MKPSRRAPKPAHAAASVSSTSVGPSPALVACGLFLLALFVRALHIRQIDGAPFTTILMGDSKSYDGWAQQIAGGDWIGRDVFYQAPLYPYFLGVVYSIAGHDVVAVRIVQSVLGSIAVLLIAHAASRLISPRAGLVAGLIAALYPPSIFFDGLIQKTALDAFLTATALWIVSGMLVAAATWRSWAALGVVMAALSLARENALALVAVVFAWCLLGAPGTPTVAPTRTRLTQGAAFLGGLALLLLPVAIRNYAVGGGFYLTTSQFGPNLYLGNNPRTDGTAGSLIAGRGSAEFERQDATDLAERAEGRTLTPAEVSSYWTGQTLDYIRSQPGDWVQLMLRKSALLWNRYEAFDTESQESYAEYSTPLRALGWLGHFGILVPLAVAGAWITWADRRRLAILYTLVVVYAASVVAFFIYARYRYPLVPFLIVFASAAIVKSAEYARGHRRQVPMLAAAVAAVIVFTNWPMLAVSDALAVTEQNVGAALQSEGKLDAAIERYRRAIEIKPDYAPAYSNLGSALVARGDLDGAIESYRRAIEIAPELADAHFNLGNALMAKGNYPAAIDAFQAALRHGPEAVDARTNLGLALSEAGRKEEALASLERAAQLSPRSVTAQYALGRLLLEMQRPGEAAPHLREATASAGATSSMFNDYGIALISAGRIDDAVAQFERAVQLDPGSREARENLAAARAEKARK